MNNAYKAEQAIPTDRQIPSSSDVNKQKLKV